MPDGKELSEEQKVQIDILSTEMKSCRYIASKIGKSKTVVATHLKNRSFYGTIKRTGRKSLLSDRVKRALISQVSNNNVSCKKINYDLPVNVSRTTIWRALNSSKFLKHKKMKKKTSTKARR